MGKQLQQQISNLERDRDDLQHRLKSISEITKQEIRNATIAADKDHYEKYKKHLNVAFGDFKKEIDILKGQLKKQQIEGLATQRLTFKLSSVIVYLELLFVDLKHKFQQNDLKGMSETLGVMQRKYLRSESRKKLEEQVSNLKEVNQTLIQELSQIDDEQDFISSSSGSENNREFQNDQDEAFNDNESNQVTLQVTKAEKQKFQQELQNKESAIKELKSVVNILKMEIDQLKLEGTINMQFSEVLNEEISQLKQKLKISENRCSDQQKIIEQLSRGQKDDFQDLQLMFFGKEKDLVSKIHEEKAKFQQFQKEIDIEIDLKDTIISRLEQHLNVLKKEIVAGKRILQDPRLSSLVTRNYRSNIEGRNSPDKFIKDESTITEILRKQDVKRQEIEVQGIPNEILNIRRQNYTPSVLRIRKKLNNSVTFTSEQQSTQLTTRNIDQTIQSNQTIVEIEEGSQGNLKLMNRTLQNINGKSFFTQRKQSKTPLNNIALMHKQISIFDNTHLNQALQHNFNNRTKLDKHFDLQCEDMLSLPAANNSKIYQKEANFAFGGEICSSRNTNRLLTQNSQRRRRNQTIIDSDKFNLNGDIQKVLEHLNIKKTKQL
eukprot:403355590